MKWKGGINMAVPTPHNSARKGDFAKTVLMPGDPLRAKFIADTYLENARLVNNVRGIQGYTGEYKGKKVSVMASGMGMPSIGIYSHELFCDYDVEKIIRIGSAGALSEDLKLKDIVIGQGACTDSNYAKAFRLPGTYAPIGDFSMICQAYEAGKKIGASMAIGNLVSSDVFYSTAASLERWKDMGVLAVEMEAAALYMNAAKNGKKALAVCTVSDCPLRGESCSSEERQTAFTQMMEIALEIA
jgi:purine-nucleoside phosphorylase